MADTMPTISKIQLPSGTIYEIKDSVAREASTKGLTIRVVDSLPTASASTTGAIYLVPSTESKEKNVKDEFITWQPTDSTYAWEQIGSTAIDLDDYAKYGDGVTVTLNALPVTGTGVNAHSITDNKHGHDISGTTTADGTNEASSVSFAASSISASKVKTDGSVTPGSANVPTVIDTTAFDGGTPTAVTLPTFSQGDDTFDDGALPELTTTVTDEILTIGWSAGSLPSFTQGEDSWTDGSVTNGKAAEIKTGFYTAGSAGTPTAVTLPTFDAVNNLVDTANAATAAAQKFTGKPSEVTGTAADAATGISIADHTVTQGTVSGNAAGTINTPTE